MNITKDIPQPTKLTQQTTSLFKNSLKLTQNSKKNQSTHPTKKPKNQKCPALLLPPDSGRALTPRQG